MTAIAPHISAFLRERLPRQRGASEHTCATYAYAFKLLFEFASARFKVPPSQLSLEQLDAPLILDFLDSLEADRRNGVSTRNARLVAIKSFMAFLEHHLPSILDQSRQIRAIPPKKTTVPLVSHLNRAEIQALLDAPNLTTRSGIRDRAMLHLCFAAGLRVSELVSLPMVALALHPSPIVRVTGKGRRERALPLWKETASDLRKWIAVRAPRPGVDELFVNARGQPMTRSGFETVLDKHVTAAAHRCRSLASKHVSPHVLRHSCALMILQGTGDLRRVALWLGHADIQTTERYLRVDPSEKLEALSSVVPPNLRSGRFKVPDALMVMLKPP
jgi:integrase/recombinase XerD